MTYKYCDFCDGTHGHKADCPKWRQIDLAEKIEALTHRAYDLIKLNPSYRGLYATLQQQAVIVRTIVKDAPEGVVF